MAAPRLRPAFCTKLMTLSARAARATAHWTATG